MVIKVTPAMLTSQSKDVINAVHEVNTVCTKVKNGITTLTSSDWAGAGSLKAEGLNQEIARGQQQIETAMHAFAGALQKAAVAYGDTDQAVAKAFTVS